MVRRSLGLKDLEEKFGTLNECVFFGPGPGLLAATGRRPHTMEPFGSSLALKTTCHSMIPVILLQNNAGTHQSSPCGRVGDRGDNGDPVVLSRPEDVLNRTALFTA